MQKMLLRNEAVIAFSFLFLLVSWKKDYLSKDQRAALFATPTVAEIDHVVSEWGKRNLTPADYTVLTNEEILDGKFRIKIVSFRINGIKEYGALVIPQTINPIPVQLYVGGFGYQVSINSLHVVVDNSATTNPRILAIPALRGQSLEITVNGILYTSPQSEGDHCNAFDGATDDVLAF